MNDAHKAPLVSVEAFAADDSGVSLTVVKDYCETRRSVKLLRRHLRVDTRVTLKPIPDGPGRPAHHAVPAEESDQ